jgi:hypothetical protein
MSKLLAHTETNLQSQWLLDKWRKEFDPIEKQREYERRKERDFFTGLEEIDKKHVGKKRSNDTRNSMQRELDALRMRVFQGG